MNEICLARSNDISIEKANQIVFDYAESIFIHEEETEAFQKLLFRVNLLSKVAIELPNIVEPSLGKDEKKNGKILQKISKYLIWFFVKSNQLSQDKKIDTEEVALLCNFAHGIARGFIRDNFFCFPNIVARVSIEMEMFCNTSDPNVWSEIQKAIQLDLLADFESRLRPERQNSSNNTIEEASSPLAEIPNQNLRWVMSGDQRTVLCKLCAQLGWIDEASQLENFLDQKRMKFEVVICDRHKRWHIGFLLLALKESDYIDHSGIWGIVSYYFRYNSDSPISKDWSNMLSRKKTFVDKMVPILEELRPVLEEIGLNKYRIESFFSSLTCVKTRTSSGRSKDSKESGFNFTM